MTYLFTNLLKKVVISLKLTKLTKLTEQIFDESLKSLMQIFVGKASCESTVMYRVKSRIPSTCLRLASVIALICFLGVGEVWGAMCFHDEFDNVGNNTDSYTSRSGWTLSNTYAHKNTGIRLGTSGGYATKTAMTNIASTKNILVTVLVADWNTDGSSLVVTVANAGNIEGNASKTISGLKAWTSTSSAVTWDNTYKVSFVVTGATSSTTIKFGTSASGKRVILGPVKFYDADAGIFKETFNSCNGTGGNDGTWSGITTGGDISVDNAGWTFVSGNKASSCARFGTGSAKGSAETPGISYSGSNDFVLTFKAGAWTSDGTTLNLSATNATLGVSSVTLVNSTWTTYNVRVTPTSTTGIKIKWEAKNKKNNRFFLDEVWITEEAAPSCEELASINGSFFGTPLFEPFSLDNS